MFNKTDITFVTGLEIVHATLLQKVIFEMNVIVSIPIFLSVFLGFENIIFSLKTAFSMISCMSLGNYLLTFAP